jgi:hypothetical protein
MQLCTKHSVRCIYRDRTERARPMSSNQACNGT